LDQKHFKFVNIIRILSIILLISLVVIVLLFQITLHYQEFNQRAEEMRTDYVLQQKAMIKDEVERAVKYIEFHRSQSEQKAKDAVQQRVHEAYAIAQNIYQQNRSSKSDAVIQQMIIDALRPIRFNNGKGYYFSTRLDGVEILFADKPEMEGMNLLNFKDTTGKFVIKDMIDIAKQSGEGFYDYYWTKPKEEGNFYKKIAFIKLFEPFDMFIGTGLYVDDMEAVIKEELLVDIDRIRFGKDGYIFVGQWDGLSLAGPGKGKNFINIEDADGKMVVKALIYTAREGGGFVEYRMPSVSNKVNELKISYTKGIDAWQWYVGSGVYVDDVEADIAELQVAGKQKLQMWIEISVLVTVVIVIIFLILFRIGRRLLGSDVALFVNFFNQPAYSDREIDLKKVRFEEFYQMAGSANKMLRDKNEAQRIELEEKEQLDVTLRSIGDGVITTDLNGKIILMNRIAEELTGWCETDAVGQLLTDVFNTVNANSRKPVENPANKVLTSGQIVLLERNSVLLSKDGTEYSIEDSAAPIRSSDSKIKGVILVFRDVTTQLKKDQELFKSRKLESIGILAGGIAHDFNNLLTSVFGNIEMAKMVLSTDEKAYKFLESAVRSVESATNLTKQLLTFAKGGDPIKETLSIGEVISEAAQFSLHGSNTKLQIDFAQDLWPVEADKGQLSQVISNLVINAQQAMPDGGTIHINGHNIKTTEGALVQITVQDEGEGIAPEYLDKIFDPYFSTKSQGSGLGLASAHSIISKHNGTISVDSKLNEGTTFTFYLPAADNLEEMGDAILEKIESSSLFDSGAHILVLDDEDDVREVIGMMLEEMGHKVSYAIDGEEAITKYREAQQNNSPYDAVITDLTIPGGMGGQEASREILQLDPQAKIIVSSGYATDPVMANYEEYGFLGRVVKPFRLSELQQVVQQVLAGSVS